VFNEVECLGVIIFILHYFIHKFKDADVFNPIGIGRWGRSQWPRGLRGRSVAARQLRSWVRIPPGAWMFVCCVLSGRGLCGELITHPEESYLL